MEAKYVSEPAYKMSWDEVEEICRAIALEADKTFGPEAVVGIAKGGLIPASMIASLLRIDIHPCVVSRRLRGELVYDRPKMIVSVDDLISGKRVLVVDEMVMSGETMRMVSVECLKKKARAVKTACLWASSDSWKPTWYGMETPGYIVFPWDYEILSRGKFVMNPSYREYLDSLEVTDSWRK